MPTSHKKGAAKVAAAAAAAGASKKTADGDGADSDNKDGSGSDSGSEGSSEESGASEEDELQQQLLESFDFFSQPLTVRAAMLKTLLDRLLTCKLPSNKKMAEFWRALDGEAGYAMLPAYGPSHKKKKEGEEVQYTLEDARSSAANMVLTVPLYDGSSLQPATPEQVQAAPNAFLLQAGRAALHSRLASEGLALATASSSASASRVAAGRLPATAAVELSKPACFSSAVVRMEQKDTAGGAATAAAAGGEVAAAAAAERSPADTTQEKQLLLVGVNPALLTFFPIRPRAAPPAASRAAVEGGAAGSASGGEPVKKEEEKERRDARAPSEASSSSDNAAPSSFAASATASVLLPAVEAVQPVDNSSSSSETSSSNSAPSSSSSSSSAANAPKGTAEQMEEEGEATFEEPLTSTVPPAGAGAGTHSNTGSEADTGSEMEEEGVIVAARKGGKSKGKGKGRKGGFRGRAAGGAAAGGDGSLAKEQSAVMQQLLPDIDIGSIPQDRRCIRYYFFQGETGPFEGGGGRGRGKGGGGMGEGKARGCFSKLFLPSSTLLSRPLPLPLLCFACLPPLQTAWVMSA